MWYTNQSTNLIITFMGKGHVHSFVSMVKKYSMFKNAHIYSYIKLWHYSDGTSLMSIVMCNMFENIAILLTYCNMIQPC